MKHISGGDIRKQYDELNAALAESLVSERFLKPDDPSLSVMDFIQTVSASMGSIKRSYHSSANRNDMVQPVLSDLDEIEAACAELREKLSREQSGDEDPEDDNKSVEDD